jgi:hypothetical protein
VHLDGCVEVERAYYGLPPGWIGRQVKVQWDALHVRILDPSNYQLLREHLRQFPGNYRIHEEDRSNKTPLSTVQPLARAAKAGPHIGQLSQAIYRNEAELGIRRILGVVALAKKHGVAAVDNACAAALDLGVENYRFVRRYLARRAGARGGARVGRPRWLRISAPSSNPPWLIAKSTGQRNPLGGPCAAS